MRFLFFIQFLSFKSFPATSQNTDREERSIRKKYKTFSNFYLLDVARALLVLYLAKGIELHFIAFVILYIRRMLS